MAEEKTKEQIELEIRELDMLLEGLITYLDEVSEVGVTEEMMDYLDDDAVADLDEDYDTKEHREIIGPKETLRILSEAFRNIKGAALGSGVPEAEISNEKLKGYYELYKIESDQEKLRIEQAKKEGKSLDEIIRGGPKIH